jgi:uncharacterized protein (TIGR02118 family)
VEHVIVGIWRSASVDLDKCHAHVVDVWGRAALAHAEVHACTIGLAEHDQGAYARDPDARGLVPSCDAMIALGLARAHDLDDVPDRDLLHGVARRVEVWRVDPHRPIVWTRTWPDGTEAPGIKMVSFMRRADGMTHEQFVRHWTQRHTALARRHHVGLWNYTQNVVRRAFTPGGEGIDGIAELHFRSRDDFETKFFDSDDGRAVIMADVKRFLSRPAGEAALMRELPLRTPAAV